MKEDESVIETFRQLTEADAASYYEVLHGGYETDRQYPISFSAMDMTLEDSLTWIQQHPTYGWFLGKQMVSSITLRMPWGPNPGPKKFPHIGHFVTAPAFMHQGYAKKILHAVEQDVLISQLKSPAVTLGTADTHPWLRNMYEGMGFICYEQVQLPGKKHRTLFFEKPLYGIIHE